jgi:hypothetical protein
MLSAESTRPYAVGRLWFIMGTMCKPREHAVYGPNPLDNHRLGGAAALRLACMPTLLERLEFIADAMPTTARLVHDMMSVDQVFGARQWLGGCGGHTSGCNGAFTVTDKPPTIDPGDFPTMTFD